MTLNFKNIDFRFFWLFPRKSVNCDENDGDRPRLGLTANINCHRLSRDSLALAQISCYAAKKSHIKQGDNGLGLGLKDLVTLVQIPGS